ncbi:MAG TPA: sensor histidine kinase [Geoalkalibacter subterraneus]|uniref:histidine kinase n=1 Tax=Geoalkalibacter subterraneus TaxID=483547 RepID=A0A831LDZ3_9BACT|nr:sensor histidine kinase [Geoalkalibacter subterraneus]
MTKNEKIRLVFLIGLVVTITALHYLTGIEKAHFHDIYRRLYYLPIVLGGLCFLLRGGLITSLTISAIYMPHVIFQWGHHPVSAPEQYLEILLYNVIGFVTGFLTLAERKQKNRYQRTAKRLEQSFAALRRQADQILEVEEQLRRADRLSALGELSAELAHEIRNPLGSIRGTAEILQDGIDPSDRRHEFAQILLREVERLNRVVEQFLDFARPARMERSFFDPKQVLEDVFSLVERQADKQGVVLEMQGDTGLVVGDGEQLKQVFLNLVLNAVQAMSDGGRLNVVLQRGPEHVEITFSDTGPGIAPEHLERIFTPFFTTRTDGIGLGLAITQRLVRKNGGALSVTSQPGKGTTFVLTLVSAETTEES